MRVLILAFGLTVLLLCAGPRLASQNIDTVVTSQSRAPISIADEIKDPAERSAFVALLGKQDPQKLLALARSFLDTYPQSAFLAPVAEKAARASFDLGALKSGLDYAHFSLLLMPENPLLLVPVADVQANLRQNEAAMASARDALDYFDRFDRPAAISEREWPALKRKQQATAWFVIGRALVNESLEGSAAAHRQSLLAQAISALSKAHELNPDDMEFVYLLGLAYRYANDWPHAAVEFAAVERHGKDFASQAHEQLQTIYAAAKPATTLDDLRERSGAPGRAHSEAADAGQRVPTHARNLRGLREMRPMPYRRPSEPGHKAAWRECCVPISRKTLLETSRRITSSTLATIPFTETESWK